VRPGDGEKPDRTTPLTPGVRLSPPTVVQALGTNLWPRGVQRAVIRGTPDYRSVRIPLPREVRVFVRLGPFVKHQRGMPRLGLDADE
jgi:hypothetical protein